MKRIKLFALMALSITVVSCKKDKEDPTITVTEPTEHSHFLWGEEVHIHATFEDDRGLKSYEAYMGDEDGNMDMSFGFHFSDDLEGVSYAFHEHFVVPDSAMMMRWVHLSVTDAEDKTATQKWMLHFDEE